MRRYCRKKLESQRWLDRSDLNRRIHVLTHKSHAFLCLLIATACAVFFNSQAATAQSVDASQLSEAQILQRFAHEPSVIDVQQSAIRYYYVHPDRIRKLLRNAELKALVPTISGEFANSLNSTIRNMEDGLYPDLKIGARSAKEYERVNGDSISWRVQASWVLDRLVFNPEVLDVQSLIGILDGLVREVTTIYYIRRRLQIDMILRPPPDLPTRISQLIRIEELTGLIDAQTGGYMTKMLRRAKLKRQRRRASNRKGSPSPRADDQDDESDSDTE